MFMLLLASCGRGGEATVTDTSAVSYKLLASEEFKPHDNFEGLEVASYSYASDRCPLELTALVYRKRSTPFIVIENKKKWLPAVYIHGGGYVFGAPVAFEGSYKTGFEYLLDQGYMFYSLAYRQSEQRSKITNEYELLDSGSGCDTNNVEIHNDINYGVSLMAYHQAGVPGVDDLLDVKAVGFGFSAGGHLIAYEGIHNQSYYRAVISISPLLDTEDLVGYLKSNEQQQAQYFSSGYNNADLMNRIVSAYSGVDPAGPKVLSEDFYDSSIHHFISQSVPMYVVTGLEDTVLPPDHAIELCDKMAAIEGGSKLKIEDAGGKQEYQCNSRHRLLLDENAGHDVAIPIGRLYDWFHTLDLPVALLKEN
jgi:acetyl esterase/lipase